MKSSVSASFVVGAVRVQPLGPCLVRVEARGPKGFEDRETFTVADRAGGEAVAAQETRGAGETVVATAHYRVVVPDNATGLDGVRVESAAGETLCELSRAMLDKKFLPAPSALPAVWVLGDAPRVVPPAWGALPPPDGAEDATSGWDLTNDAPDAYVFFPRAAGYARFRADFLRLTGGIPLVPLYALGLWYSRYFAYSEETAVAVIERFRQENIPLDVFVADTDWRVGASCGYAVNEALFPDMARFVRQAHARQVRIMLNDHPEPKGKSALDPEELRFRRNGLVSLLEKGVDLWWFDRNWHTHLQAPAPGLDKEVWGMRLYRDVTQAFRPERRPLIMSNVDGINNGRRDAPSHPAAHRFPVWWTGDTCAEWNYLRLGISNAVDGGIDSLLPYVHEDLGGHHGQPDPELYVRFMQFGAFSPVARIHCTTNVHRYPWGYGAAVAQVVGDYFRLRYRLLPLLYSAAHEAHWTGLPVLRRCDLEWPEFPEAADPSQYLLGDDLLVAPILEPARRGAETERTVWIPPGEWQDLWSGRVRRGPATIGVCCRLDEMPLFVRRGGVVLSAPQRQSTGVPVWPELVVDAFVPTEDMVQTRKLYEDDGISTAHEKGVFALTEFTLRRQGDEIALAIASVRPEANVLLRNRKLAVRFHLPAGFAPAAGDCTVIQGQVTQASELFAGAEAPGTNGEGPVVLIRAEMDPSMPLTLRLAAKAG